LAIVNRFTGEAFRTQKLFQKFAQLNIIIYYQYATHDPSVNLHRPILSHNSISQCQEVSSEMEEAKEAKPFCLFCLPSALMSGFLAVCDDTCFQLPQSGCQLLYQSAVLNSTGNGAEQIVELKRILM